jgi:AcrR family transcriptional regulator
VRRQQLLDSVVGYLAQHGLGLLSLRPLAAGLGVSTNRLVHHFGTKDQLITAALDRAVQIQEEVRASWLAAEPGLGQVELLRRWWAWMQADSGNLAMVRLAYEAVTLDATVTGLPTEVRDAQISVWRTNIEQRLISGGMPAAEAAIEASLVKATYSGLVLELIASGSSPRLSAALDTMLARLEDRLAVRRVG